MWLYKKATQSGVAFLFLGEYMLVAKKSFGKKFLPLILVAAAVLIATSMSAGGVWAFGKMLEIGESERSISSSNESAS